jgi:hypothetical protein
MDFSQRRVLMDSLRKRGSAGQQYIRPMNLEQCYSAGDVFSLDLLNGWPDLIPFSLKVLNLFWCDLPEF